MLCYAYIRLYIYFNHFKCVCVTTSAGQKFQRRTSFHTSVGDVLVVVVVWKLDNDLWGVKSNFILISFHFQPSSELRHPPSASICFKVENERHMRHVKYENKSQWRKIESFGTFDSQASEVVQKRVTNLWNAIGKAQHEQLMLCQAYIHMYIYSKKINKLQI